MAPGLTIQPNGQTLIVTAGPAATFYTDTGLSSVVTYPVAVTTDTVWYCSAANAVDQTLTITQPDGSTVWDKPIRVGQTTDTYIRPTLTAAQLAADLVQGHTFISGQYYPLGGVSGTTTAVQVQSTLYLGPWILSSSVSIAKIGAEVTTGAAASTVRLGIYSDVGGYPATLLYDSGASDGTLDGNSVASQDVTCATPIVLPAGIYWFGTVAQGGAPTLRQTNNWTPPVQIAYGTSAPGSAGRHGYTHASVTGALPATFNARAAAGVASNVPRVHIKIT